jgi:hypothetical protein
MNAAISRTYRVPVGAILLLQLLVVESDDVNIVSAFYDHLWKNQNAKPKRRKCSSFQNVFLALYR